jgi:hypothetical protein
MRSRIRISGDQVTRMKDNRSSGDQEKPVAGFEGLWVWQKAHQFAQQPAKGCGFLPSQE